jgi:hypothetical protein
MHHEWKAALAEPFGEAGGLAERPVLEDQSWF